MNPLVISGLFSAAQSLIERFFPDKEKQAAAQLELLKMQQNGDLAQLAADTDLAKLQIQTNIEEAKSTNWWVAGWRPAIGWVCGAGLAYAALVEPFARFAAKVWFGYTGDFPVIDTDLTMQILMGMLGLGAMRSVEKVKNAEGHR
tara:strand:+ start:262 stop:696 length:435 start_codon:yes stop_codon:yes gene_type:complete